MVRTIFSQILDEKSENLVYLLSLDSRQSISDLAKKMGLSRRRVEHRVLRLFGEGCIKYLTVNNAPPGFRMTLLAKLRTFDAELLDRLKKVSSLIKLKEMLGMYDISILCDLPSKEQRDHIVKEVSDLLHQNTLRFDVLPHIWEDTLGYKSFCHKPALLNEYRAARPVDRVATKREQRVLSLLKKNTNMSYRELSEKGGMGYRKLKEVLDTLRKDGFLRCTVDPDYRKLGLQFHNLLVKIELGQQEAFERYIAQHPRVHWVKHSRGRWDYVLSITSRDVDEFIDITRQIRSENAKILLDAQALIAKVRETRRH